MTVDIEGCLSSTDCGPLKALVPTYQQIDKSKSSLLLTRMVLAADRDALYRDVHDFQSFSASFATIPRVRRVQCLSERSHLIELATVKMQLTDMLDIELCRVEEVNSLRRRAESLIREMRSLLRKEQQQLERLETMLSRDTKKEPQASDELLTSERRAIRAQRLSIKKMQRWISKTQHLLVKVCLIEEGERERLASIKSTTAKVNAEILLFRQPTRRRSLSHREPLQRVIAKLP